MSSHPKMSENAVEKIEDTDTAIKDTNELNVNIEGSDKENNNDKSVKKLDINE